ncbi:solute carrier family 35 member G1-like [Actinia tenebrosa]|uniref:Solute carrier family 35 member G1-like n=1 Tax=Actinia tenebrosa TaxID=6105 RepID=A0A6P8J3S3_ACTTE|nr:solute carrier family 35 member G1-like [Actinia tenebrosa]
MADEVEEMEIEPDAVKYPTCSLIPSCANNVNEDIKNTEDDVRQDPSSNDVVPKTTSCCRPFFGISFAILSTFAVVLTNLFAKLCKQIPVFEIGLIRFMIQLAITIPFVIHANDKIVFSPKIIVYLILRGFTGTSAMLTRLYAVQNMPIGDATVLMFTTPVFVAIFGRIFLKEPLHRIYIFLLLLCLAGVTLIARPVFIFGHQVTTEYENIWLPSLVAVSSSIFGGFSFIFVKLLKKHFITSSVIIFYHGLVGLIYSICGSYFDRGFQFPFCKSIDYIYAILVGVFGYLIQAALNAALKFEKAVIVSLTRTLGIVFGFVVQVLVFSLVPSGLSFGGAALISLSNVIILIFKWKKSKRDREVEFSAT